MAEDNQFTIQQYKHVLEKNGFSVTLANDGEECMKKYNKAFLKLDPELLESGPFDVVLIDNTAFICSKKTKRKRKSPGRCNCQNIQNPRRNCEFKIVYLQ